MQTVDEILPHAASKIPDALLFSYPAASGTDFIDYTASDLETRVQRVAKHYATLLPTRRTSSTPQKVVAVLTNSNLDYVVTLLALGRLGLTSLLLSTRIADEGYAHLLTKTSCSDLVVHESFNGTISRVKELLRKDINIVGIKECVRAMEDASLDGRPLDVSLDTTIEADIPCWIIHSSGSTGLPKPVSFKNKSAVKSLENIGAMSTRSDALITLPLFHGFGLMALFGGFYSGTKNSLHNSQLPLTGDVVLEELRSSRSLVLQSVPYVLKVLSETKGGVDALAKLKYVFVGGSSIPQDLGTGLVKAGVKLMDFYGSTEGGGMMSNSISCTSPPDWCYLTPVAALLPHSYFRPEGEGLYELVLKSTWPALSARNLPDGSYATRDLFTRHPTDENKWKFFSRLDDTIILTNGENANPIPIEMKVRQAPEVKEVVVVGAERSCLGMFVIPSDNGKAIQRDEFVDRIWSFVEAGNKVVPAYSQITKDAIVILPEEMTYPATDKGTIIRTAFQRKFSKEIDALFESLEKVDYNAGLSLSFEETKQFVREVVEDVLKNKAQGIELRDDSDFFIHGLDSLMATTVWRRITRGLNTGGVEVGRNVAFEKPTIEKLARYLYGLRTGETVEGVSYLERMEEMLQKYSVFRQHTPGSVEVDGEYVVLTGATGSLGAHLVAQLASRPDVRKIYCLVRASSPEKAIERTIASLKERRILSTLSESALKKIEAYPPDLGQETLGLSPEIFAEIKRTTTNVIHAGWTVNFNMDVTSFEVQCIRGSYNLINLCLSSPHRSPPRFNFCSSISTTLKTPSKTISERLYTLAEASELGYAQAKAITEHMTANAASNTSLKATVLRIGQIVGDTVHGVWNAHEAESMIIQAAHTVHAMPLAIAGEDGEDEVRSWLPVDTTAMTIIDLSLPSPKANPTLVNGSEQVDEKENIVYHVAHPDSIKWNADILPALKKAGLQFDAVEPKIWLQRLQTKPNPEENPPMKLWDFFVERYGGEGAANGRQPYFETVRSQKVSRSLRDARPVDEELIGKFVDYWKSSAW